MTKPQQPSPKPDESAKKPLRVFVVSPIGSKGDPAYKRAKMALEYIIRPVVREVLGVEAKRGDDDNRPGVITNHIMEDIHAADLVIANLTGLNGNVMYELGLAHALSKPTIHMTDVSTGLPFDNQQYRTIFFETDDPDSHAEARKILADQIRQTQGNGYEPVNPFTVAVKLSKLPETNISDKALLAEMQESIGTLHRQFEVLQMHFAKGVPAQHGGQSLEEVLRAVKNNTSVALRDLVLASTQNAEKSGVPVTIRITDGRDASLSA